MDTGHILHDFRDVAEYLDYAGGPSALPVESRASRDEGDRKWSGSDNYTEAEGLARHGWPDGLARVQPIADYLAGVIGQKMTRASWQLETTGLFVDVAEYLTGAPECFWNEQEHEGAGRVPRAVSVYVAGRYHSGVSAEAIARRGAACIALVDTLEEAGARAEVSCVFEVAPNVGGYWGTLTFRFVLKRADEPMDRDRLAFWLMNPAAFRRIGFSAMERERSKDVRKGYGVKKYGGYGVAARVEFTGDGYDRTGIFLDGNQEFRTDAEAAQWVIRTAEAQGVIFED